MEMLFTLFLTLLCIDANNGAPVNNDRNTTASARITDEYAKIFRSHRLQNSDLFFLSKQPEFHNPANEELNRRIKVRIIDSSKKLDMKQHYPFNTIKSSDFEQLEGWQPNIFIAFNYNNLSTKDSMIDDQLQSFRCFYVMRDSNGFAISWKYSHDGNLGNYKQGLIIPMMPDTYVDIVYYYKICYLNGVCEKGTEKMNDVKLVIVFENQNYWSIWGKDWSTDGTITNCGVNSSIPICYAKYFDLKESDNISDAFMLMFGGKNVEADAIRVTATNNEELKAELLEWKNGLHFLNSHQIIAYHFKVGECQLRKSKKIFKEVFGIKPITLFFKQNNFETGMIDSTRLSRNVGPVFVILGFKNF